MKIAVLASGPSLLKYWSEEKRKEYDLTIACCMAASKFSSDVVAAFDQIAVDAAIEPDQGWFTSFPISRGRAYIHSIAHLNKFWSLEVDDKYEMAAEFCCYTVPCVLSKFFSIWGSDEIDLYGADFTEEDDVAGQGVWSRARDRWEAELPWIKRFWKPHYRLISDASEADRNYIYGK